MKKLFQFNSQEVPQYIYKEKPGEAENTETRADESENTTDNPSLTNEEIHKQACALVEKCRSLPPDQVAQIIKGMKASPEGAKKTGEVEFTQADFDRIAADKSKIETKLTELHNKKREEVVGNLSEAIRSKMADKYKHGDETLDRAIKTTVEALIKEKTEAGTAFKDIDLNDPEFSKSIEQQVEAEIVRGKIQFGINDALRETGMEGAKKIMDERIIEAIKAKLKAMDPSKLATMDEATLKETVKSMAEEVRTELEAPLKTEKEEAYTKKEFTNQAFATGNIETIKNEETGEETHELRLRGNGILSPEEAKKLIDSGTIETISFNNNDNLRTIGAGDRYPSEVREIEVDGRRAIRKDNAEGGSFFYVDGQGNITDEYAKIVNGTKVKPLKMATEKEMSAISKKVDEHIKQFGFEGEKLAAQEGNAWMNEEVEIAPGKKFKKHELINQMAQRYGIDPHLLMLKSKDLSTSGTDYLKELNMNARGIDRALGKIGDEAYTTNPDGRRHLKPKYLRLLLGANNEGLKNYVKHSGADFSGMIKNPDGTDMTHDEVMDYLENNVPGFEMFDGKDGTYKIESAAERAELVKILSSRFDNASSGSMANFENGINGVQLGSAKGLMELDQLMRNSMGYSGPKGYINSATGGKHGSGDQSHGAGCKWDIRCNPSKGATSNYGQALWQFAKQHGNARDGKTYDLTLASGTKVMIYRHDPDHLDLKIISPDQDARHPGRFKDSKT